MGVITEKELRHKLFDLVHLAEAFIEDLECLFTVTKSALPNEHESAYKVLGVGTLLADDYRHQIKGQREQLEEVAK